MTNLDKLIDLLALQRKQLHDLETMLNDWAYSMKQCLDEYQKVIDDYNKN